MILRVSKTQLQSRRSRVLAAGFGLIVLVATGWLLKPRSSVSSEGEGDAPAQVTVIEAERGDVRRVFRLFSGLQPWKEAVVKPTAQGVVRELLVQVGDSVRRDQPIVRMDSEAQRLRGELEDIDMEAKKLDFNIAMALARKDFLSQQEKRQKELENRANQIRVRLSQLENRGVFRSPIAGLVAEVGLKPGDYIDGASSQGAIRIVDIEKLKVTFWIPQSVAGQISRGSEVRLKLKDEIGEARLNAIAPTVDPKSGSVYAEAELAKIPSGWKVGQFVEVLLTLEKRSGVIVVPKSALVFEQGKPSVYVVRSGARGLASDEGSPKDGETVEKLAVETGLEENEQVEVTKGLAELDQVVVGGLSGLAPGAQVEINY